MRDIRIDAFWRLGGITLPEPPKHQNDPRIDMTQTDPAHTFAPYVVALLVDS